MIFTLTDRDYNPLDSYETTDYLIGVYTKYLTSSLEMSVLVENPNAGLWAEGNYILCKDKDGKKYWFTIYKADDSLDSPKREIQAYSGSLDIMNEDSEPIAYPSKALPFKDYFEMVFGNDSGIEIGINEIANMTRSLEFTSENATMVEMIQYVLNGFDGAEAELEVDWEGSVVKSLRMNVFKRIGRSENVDIITDDNDSLISVDRTGSIEDLATALKPFGTTEDNKDLTLVGKEYTEKDPDTGEILYISEKNSPYIKSRKAHKQYFVNLEEKHDIDDNHGYIVRRYSSQAKTQDALWSAGLAQLKTIDHALFKYEVKGQTKAKIGDSVQVISKRMNPPLYLEARLMELKYNDDIENVNEYTFGNYKELTSNMDRISEWLNDIKNSIVSIVPPVVTEYAASTDGEKAPLDGWMTTIPKVNPGMYLWTRTTTQFTNGDISTSYSVARQGEDGKPGKEGLGIQSSTVTFCISESGTVAPAGPWTETIPSTPDRQYLWTRTQILYTDNTFENVYTVGRMGADAKALFLSSTMDAFSFNADGTIKPGQTAEITARPQNITGSIEWKAIPYIKNTPQTEIALTGSGMTRILSSDLWTNKNWDLIAITAIMGGYTDTLSVRKTLDGLPGKDGEDGSDGLPGKDGVGISRTTIQFAISSSGTIKPTSGWTETVPTLVKGMYLWTKTTWLYTDNKSEDGYSVGYISKDGNDGDDGLPGKDGVGIRNTIITYAKNDSGVTPPQTGWIATPPSLNAGDYLWTKVVWEYTDNSMETSYSVSRMGEKGDPGNDGLPGKDGKGVKSTAITYAISATGQTPPSSGWSGTVPSLTKGMYLWTKTVWTYTDNTNETGYSVSYVSKDGNNGEDGLPGKDGVGIKSTAITYAASTSGVTAPTSGWAANPPTVSAGQYLWTKIVWTYTDNTTETGYSVAKMGNNGAPGAAAYVHYAWAFNKDGSDRFTLTYPTAAPYPTFQGTYSDTNVAGSTDPKKYVWQRIMGEDGTPGKDGTDGLDVFSGYLTNEAALIPANANGVVTDYTKGNGQFLVYLGQTQLTTGVTFKIESQMGMVANLNKDTGAYSVTRLDEDSGMTIFSATYNGIVLKKNLMANKVRQGPSGSDGKPGKDGMGITKTTVTYTKSESGTVTPSSGWQTTIPVVPGGQFLWTKTVWTYTDNTDETGYSVSKMGEAGQPGTPGATIDSTKVEYRYSSDSSTPPPHSWSTTIPEAAPGLFLWTRVTKKWSDGTTDVSYSIAYSPKDGVGITSTRIRYATTQDGVNPPASESYWSEAIPAVRPGWFLWTRTMLLNGGNALSTSFQVTKMGADGTDGAKGDPTGIVESSTVPTSAQRYNGMLWRNTGAAGYLKDTVYRWNGSAWEIFTFSAVNIHTENLSAISANLGKITAGDITGVNITGSRFVSPINDDHVDWGSTVLDDGELRSDYTEPQGSTYDESVRRNSFTFSGISGMTSTYRDKKITGQRGYSAGAGGFWHTMWKYIKVNSWYRIATRIGVPTNSDGVDAAPFSYTVDDWNGIDVGPSTPVDKIELWPDKLVLRKGSTGDQALTIDTIQRLANVGKQIWSGASYMHSGQTMTMSVPLSKTFTGWLIQWQGYANGALVGSDFNYQLVPRWHLNNFSGAGTGFAIRGKGTTEASQISTKYVYITDTTIKGYDINSKGKNTDFVMSKVFAI